MGLCKGLTVSTRVCRASQGWVSFPVPCGILAVRFGRNPLDPMGWAEAAKEVSGQSFGFFGFGALIIRVGFWGPLYYNCSKEPPK